MASFKAIESESLTDLVKNSDIEEHNVDKNRVHKYKLNDKAAKAKLVKGAKREPFDVIKNVGSSNLDFSLGAWNYVVLPTVRYWNQVKDDKTCKVDDIVIKIGSVELGKEAGGRHVDTKVVFYANRDKVVLHLYNTTQRILVNGNGYDNLINIFLKPYFLAKISQNIQNVEIFNKEALSVLSGKRKAVTRPTRSVRYKALVRPSCNQCEESFVNKSLLGAHTKSTHKKKSNSSADFSNLPLVDDLSLMDLSVNDAANEVELEEISSIESHICTKCQSVFGKEEDLKVHHEKDHEHNKDPIIYNCGKCEQKYFTFKRLAEHIDQQHNPAPVTEQNSVEIQPLKSCDKCDFSTEKDVELKDHLVKDIHVVQDQNKSISSDKSKSENSNITKNSMEKAEETHTVDASVTSDSTSSQIKCKKCGIMFNNHEHLETHMKEKHLVTNIYHCTSCEYRTTVHRNLKMHVEASHTTESHNHNINKQKNQNIESATSEEVKYTVVICGECGSVFQDMPACENHIEHQHRTTPTFEPTTCDECNLVLANTKLMQEHKEKYHNESRQKSEFPCDECIIISKDSESLKTHKTDYHSSSCTYECITGTMNS